jgi:hypothetical protein
MNELVIAVKGFLLCWPSVFGQLGTESPIKNQSRKFIQMLNSIRLARTKEDKRFVADVYFVSQHSRKPPC